MIYYYIRISLEKETLDLIGLITDIGLQEKYWINLGVTIDKSRNSYGYQDKQKIIELTHL